VFGRVVLPEESMTTSAFAQVSQPTSGISNPTSSTSCSNGVASCNGASQALLTPVQDGAGHHAMAMGALGVSLVIVVAAVYAIIMLRRWS
jgi:hypothetical protein